MANHTLTSSQLTISIVEHGAELRSIQTPQGREWLWQADPKVWPRHAPILFPIVGRLKDDTLRHQDKTYRLTQHGFARDMAFAIERHGANHCTLLLKDDATTRAQFPFAFELRVTYQVTGNRINIFYEVTNPGADSLPFGIGAHPGFVWPLAPDVAKDAHRISFTQAEPQPIRRLENGLLLPDPFPTPITEQSLALNDELFRRDVVLFDHINSRSVTFEAPGKAAITIGFPDFPHFGIWTKPGADFLCIEPWQGYASPQDFDGPFVTKPGLAHLAPGEARTWHYWIDITN